MIKRLLNKIKGLFGKNKGSVEQGNKCPYKIESEVIVEKEVMLCEHCKTELKGKESATDETGAKYIWCNSCNYVNKVKEGKVIRKENNGQEVMKAFKLFRKAGITPSGYSYEKNGEKQQFN